MDREDIIRMAREAGLHLATDVNWMPIIDLEYAEKFAALVAAAEREKVAAWMIQRGYTTGHGDTTEDLLKELEWQVAENWTNALVKGVEGERQRIVNLLMIQHEAAKGAHNYWHVAAQLIQADVASDT